MKNVILLLLLRTFKSLVSQRASVLRRFVQSSKAARSVATHTCFREGAKKQYPKSKGMERSVAWLEAKASEVE